MFGYPSIFKFNVHKHFSADYLLSISYGSEGNQGRQFMYVVQAHISLVSCAHMLYVLKYMLRDVK